jgi:hypothetical protein
MFPDNYGYLGWITTLTLTSGFTWEGCTGGCRYRSPSAYRWSASQPRPRKLSASTPPGQGSSGTAAKQDVRASVKQILPHLAHPIAHVGVIGSVGYLDSIAIVPYHLASPMFPAIPAITPDTIAAAAERAIPQPNVASSATPRISDEAPAKLAPTAVKNQSPTRPREPSDAI